MLDIVSTELRCVVGGRGLKATGIGAEAAFDPGPLSR
jgi:hypothetical protein